jgi:enamine deaminase RidA (YjgF/YER057c/UK114 family)
MSPIQVIKSPDGPPAASYLSAAIRAGDFVFVSGNAGFVSRHAVDAGTATAELGQIVPGGIREQTKATLENIALTLESAGCGLADVVRVNGYLRDVDRDFWEYNEVYESFFPNSRPARTTVGVTILNGILVEIDCVAYSPASQRS